MQIDIDLVIVALFLIVNLSVGVYFGRNTRTIKDYAIGNRNFSTSTIAATIVATWISGDFFTVAVSDTYREGLWFVFAGAGDIIALLIIGRILGTRMKEFFGSLSVAEVMGNLYGKNIRIITAIASIAHAVGVTSLQIKVFSTIFSHFLGMSSVYATLVSSFVVIFYSTFGGIRAVTFTDVIQFFTFGIFIPIFALFVWQVFGSTELISNTFENSKLFDYHELINYKNPNFFPYLLLFIYCAIPSVNSTLFQRTLMAKNTNQIRQSFTIAGVLALIIHIFSCFIGLVVLSHDPTISPDNVAMYVVDNYSFVGLKGVAIIGIMAMVMSTADSWVNTASVVFSHDLCKSLGIKFKNELLVSRIFAVFVGIGSVSMTLSTINISILQLYLLKANFYKPVVTVPLILAILGFRSSAKVVGAGMFAGGLSALIWKINITPLTGIDSVVPAMAMNLITYMGAHYLLYGRKN